MRWWHFSYNWTFSCLFIIFYKLDLIPFFLVVCLSLLLLLQWGEAIWLNTCFSSFPDLAACNTTGTLSNIFPMSVIFQIYDWSWKSQAILCSSILLTIHLCSKQWHPCCPTFHFKDFAEPGQWRSDLLGKEQYLLASVSLEAVMSILNPAFTSSSWPHYFTGITLCQRD